MRQKAKLFFPRLNLGRQIWKKQNGDPSIRNRRLPLFLDRCWSRGFWTSALTFRRDGLVSLPRRFGAQNRRLSASFVNAIEIQTMFAPCANNIRIGQTRTYRVVQTTFEHAPGRLTKTIFFKAHSAPKVKNSLQHYATTRTHSNYPSANSQTWRKLRRWISHGPSSITRSRCLFVP